MLDFLRDSATVLEESVNQLIELFDVIGDEALSGKKDAPAMLELKRKANQLPKKFKQYKKKYKVVSTKIESLYSSYNDELNEFLQLVGKMFSRTILSKEVRRLEHLLLAIHETLGAFIGAIETFRVPVSSNSVVSEIVGNAFISITARKKLKSIQKREKLRFQSVVFNIIFQEGYQAERVGDFNISPRGRVRYRVLWFRDGTTVHICDFRFHENTPTGDYERAMTSIRTKHLRKDSYGEWQPLQLPFP